MKKFLKWGGIALAVLIVLSIIGSAVSDEDTSSSNSNGSQEVVSENKQVEDKPAEKEEKKEEVVVVDITEFVEEFDKNQLAAEENYEGKTVQFTGYVGNISEDIMGSYFVTVNPTSEEYYFGTAVQCYFEDKNKSQLTALENGQEVTLIGNFDTQLMNVLVKKCEVVN